MKFKGHTTIELTDVETGEVSTLESNNFMTNGLQKMLTPLFCVNQPSQDIFLTADHYTMLRKFFGGLYLFDTTLGTSANTIYAPPGVKLTGRGSNVPYTGADLSMGSYNNTLSGIYESDSGDRTGYKFVWDFTTEQGNGTIKSACLTSIYGASCTQGCKYDYSNDTSSLTDTLGRFKNSSVTEAYQIWADDTGRVNQEKHYRWPYAVLYVDLANNYRVTLGDAREIMYCGGSAKSDSDNFKNSIFYKKSITLKKMRIPASNYSAFDFANLDSYNAQNISSAKDNATIGSVTVNMPTNLASAVTTALNRGASNWFVPSIHTDEENLYIMMSMNEGKSNSAGVPTGSHIYVWKIHFPDFSTTYYDVTNNTGEPIAYLGVTYGSTTLNNSYYAGEYTMGGIVNGTHLFTLGYTSKKGYLISLSNPTDVRTVKLASDETTDVVFPYNYLLKRTTSVAGKLYVCNTSGSHWAYSGSSSTGSKHYVIDPTLGVCEYRYNVTPGISTFWYPSWAYQTVSTPSFRIKDTPLFYTISGSYHNSTAYSYFRVGIDPAILMTINNLDSTITKTSAQTMRVTYTVTIEES